MVLDVRQRRHHGVVFMVIANHQRKNNKRKGRRERNLLESRWWGHNIETVVVEILRRGAMQILLITHRSFIGTPLVEPQQNTITCVGTLPLESSQINERTNLHTQVWQTRSNNFSFWLLASPLLILFLNVICNFFFRFEVFLISCVNFWYFEYV